MNAVNRIAAVLLCEDGPYISMWRKTSPRRLETAKTGNVERLNGEQRR